MTKQDRIEFDKLVKQVELLKIRVTAYEDRENEAKDFVAPTLEDLDLYVESLHSQLKRVTDEFCFTLKKTLLKKALKDGIRSEVQDL